eukprot:5613657-Pleurochrysis_carterae.AAC.3
MTPSASPERLAVCRCELMPRVVVKGSAVGLQARRSPCASRETFGFKDTYTTEATGVGHLVSCQGYVPIGTQAAARRARLFLENIINDDCHALIT